MSTTGVPSVNGFAHPDDPYQVFLSPRHLDKLKSSGLTPETIMAAKTSKTRAVVLAHTLGNPFRADL